ncbi:PREDICTED: uncharacterized protein C2orf78-like [Elephantulus edwardii]|uniref:uncharacterized protein C2orf78-like n=1 Tax=Elephantulus edwardii TaxID=28737 RepID=UPI0003F0C239|nr:PREDICTED: uncharacterized protein C2orf78-like [Elephantulus edwardii]
MRRGGRGGACEGTRRGGALVDGRGAGAARVGAGDAGLLAGSSRGHSVLFKHFNRKEDLKHSHSSNPVSRVEVSSSLTMSGNFPCPSLLGTPDSRQLSLPVVSNAAPFTGSVSNSCRVSVPAVSSAWLLPSDPVSSFQPLLGSAYLYQPSDTSLQSAVWGQNQIPIVSSSYPGIIEWNLTRSSQKKSSSLGDSTFTIIDQDTAMSSMPMTIHYDKPLDTTTIGSLYPSLPVSLVQGPPSQGHSFSVPHQEGIQVYYYNQGTVGPLLSGDLGPCLQSYGTELYTGDRAPAPQPEMALVLKEIQPANALLPSSTSGTYYSFSAQPISEARFPGQPAVTNPARPSILQSVPPKPAAYTAASGAALQRDPVTTVGSKLQPPPKPQSQFLLEDFSLQPIPWRKPNVPEPLMSKPITKEQRPEREAMKRRAQQEREEAAKYTALGKVRFFAQREKGMEISRFYGYAL